MSKETWVVKVGSSLVTAGGGGVNRARLANWAYQIAQLRERGIRVILVSSGAIAEGVFRLGWKERPKTLNKLQAAAAVGQMKLAQAYEEVFEAYHIQTAQILLTHDDMGNRTRYLNARSTLSTLLDFDILPIINENDTVSTGEIKLGDNDTLGALVANLLDADLLVILTDQESLYDSDPRHNPNAKPIAQIDVNHPDLLSMAGKAGTSVGTGGMVTKITAARRAAQSGTSTRIASGSTDNVLVRLADGQSTGSLLTAGQSRINAKAQWLIGQLHLAGKVIVDNGARNALINQHSSLLSVGCIAVEGNFHRGTAVAICDESGTEIARGLINYSCEEMQRILRTPSDQIEERLGYIAEEEVIHRDNMVNLISTI